jgi:hypothetical protein
VFVRYFSEDDGLPQGGEADEGVADKFQARLAKMKGDAQAFAFQLYRDNYDLRQKNAELRGKVPAEGAVILTGDDATRWQAYTALGAPDEVQAALSEGSTAKAEAARLQRAQTVQQAAQAAGFKPAVLERLIGDLPLALADGKATVQTEAGAVDLAAHAEAAWPEFLPALRTSADPLPPRVPSQPAGGGSPRTKSAAQRQIETRYTALPANVTKR